MWVKDDASEGIVLFSGYEKLRLGVSCTFISLPLVVVVVGGQSRDTSNSQQQPADTGRTPLPT